MGFEHLEQRTASAAMAHIGNADVVLGTQPLRGIFDAAAEQVLDGMVVGVGPRLTLLTSLCGHLRSGDALQVNGRPYVVSEPPEPNGTGLTALQLRQA